MQKNIRLLDVIKQCFTNETGIKLLGKLTDALGHDVTLMRFTGVNATTLLDSHSLGFGYAPCVYSFVDSGDWEILLTVTEGLFKYADVSYISFRLYGENSLVANRLISVTREEYDRFTILWDKLVQKLRRERLEEHANI